MSTLKTLFRFCTASLLILSLFVPATTASAVVTIRYVAPGGACGGASPCYTSVQAAVTAAAAGDEIRVAAGTYTGVNTLGGLSQMVYITKSLTIKGGYTTEDWLNQDPDTNATELQAQTLGRVVYISGATTSVTLNGLHLTYGNADGLGGHSPTSFENYDAGGGVYAYQSALTINHCWLANNAAPGGYGGGIYKREGTLNIVASQFTNNEAGLGGGAYLYYGQSQIEGNTRFDLNRVTAANPGGVAITARSGTLTLTNSTIADNTVTFGGMAGAVYVDHAQFFIDNVEVSGSIKSDGISTFVSDGTLQNSYIHHNDGRGVSVNNNTVTLAENEIAYNDAGVSIDAVSDMDVTLRENFIHHNQTDAHGTSASGGGVYLDANTGSALLTGNIIQDNVAGVLGGTIPSWGIGGGVYITGDNATLVGNLIQNNTAIGFIWAGNQYWGGLGGGVYTNYSPTLINNVITGNNARFKGSGVFVKGGSPKFYQTTIAHNSAGATDDETGIYVEEKSSTEKAQPKLWNTIIANQKVGIYNKGDVTSNVVFADEILWYGNTSNSDGAGTFFLSNEATGDPLFVDPVTFDYHIGTGSAAIDIGTNAFIPAGIDADADGHPRIANGIVDLGAYENQDRFLLAVSKLGGGSGTVTSDPAGIDCGADCSETFDANSLVTLTATADPGSTFMGWSGDADCADGQVTLTEDTSCKARFYLPVTLTVTKSGNGSGTVTSVPAGISCGADCTEIYDTGTKVTLKATAAAGSAFARWTGAADCSDGKVTLNADMTCTAVFKKLVTAKFRSVGANDGWILEKTETSNTGGTLNANATVINLGDDASDRQYRAILSFNTATLPDSAVITGVTLKVKRQGVVGTDPFNTHGNILADIRKGAFSNSNALQSKDFQAAASKTGAVTIRKTLAAGWYSGNLLKTAFPFVNLKGVTQFRLRFAKDDNDDHGADYLKIFSGNAATASRPMLVVTYYVP